MTKKISKRIYVGLIFFALFFLSGVLYISLQKNEVPFLLQGVLRPGPKLLKEFDLLDQDKVSVNKFLFKDKWSLVFFGYTSCPDICPTTLHVLNSFVTTLEKKEEKLFSDTQVVFISVDPERDAVDVLADYTKFFNEDFIGLTGNKENIDNITQQFGAGYMMDEKNELGDYQVSHTSAIFLVSPESRLVAAFSQPHISGTIVSQYTAIRQYLSN